MQEIEISKIKIGKRHRKEFGDIQSLADSIREIGLLQPIGITEDNELIFGERRIKAMQILEQNTILARVIPIKNLVEGEFHENEHHKGFTVSERVAIGNAIEKLLGNRRGRRTDLELQDNCPEVKPGIQTRDIAAQKAGFNNYRTYERAKAVVEHGAPELVEKMDSGQVSVSAAATVTKNIPKEQQAGLTPIEVRKTAKLLSSAGKQPAEAGTGGMVIESDGSIAIYMTPEQHAQSQIWFAFKEGLWSLATLEVTPAELLAIVPDYQQYNVSDRIKKVVPWLETFYQLWMEHRENVQYTIIAQGDSGRDQPSDANRRRTVTSDSLENLFEAQGLGS